MIKTAFLSALLTLSLSACNLYSGIAGPSNEEQYLMAARGCMDRGDFNCALEYYGKLSSSTDADTKINETSLATLGRANVFLMSDLVGSLGNSRGSGSSFSAMANDLAARGAATSANRVLILKTYTDNAAISNAQLRAFSQFISAISMFNAVIAAAVPGGGVLTGSNLVSNAATCAAASVGSSNITACDPPASSGISDTTESSLTLAAGQDWSTTPTIDKAIIALQAANTQINILTGSSSLGIFDSIKAFASAVSSLPGGATAVARAKRNLLLNFLFAN